MSLLPAADGPGRRRRSSSHPPARVVIVSDLVTRPAGPARFDPEVLMPDPQPHDTDPEAAEPANRAARRARRKGKGAKPELPPVQQPLHPGRTGPVAGKANYTTRRSG